MKEDTYKFLGGAAATNIAIGVIAIVIGVSAGVLLIVNGGKILASRKGMII